MDEFEPTFRDYLGIETVFAGDDRSVLVLHPRPEHLNRHGTVHGGVLATLADVAGAEAVSAGLRRNLGVTVEMRVSFLEPARSAEIRAEARLLRRGSHFCTVVVEVRQGELLIAHATGTFTTKS